MTFVFRHLNGKQIRQCVISSKTKQKQELTSKTSNTDPKLSSSKLLKAKLLMSRFNNITQFVDSFYSLRVDFKQ